MLSNDYLPGTKMPIWQDPDMFRINTDTQLLGMFLRIRKGSRVLDIGTNNGALLLYAARLEPAELTGIDPQEKAVLLARRNLPVPLRPLYAGSWALITTARVRDREARRAWWDGFREGWRMDPEERRPMRWSTVWAMTKAGRPPIV